MSDTFDHEADAWDSFLFGQDADGEYISWDDDRHSHRIVSWSSSRAYTPKQKICRHCGQRGLRWIYTYDKGWRLFDGNTEHVCGSRGATSLFRKLINAP